MSEEKKQQAAKKQAEQESAAAETAAAEATAESAEAEELSAEELLVGAQSLAEQLAEQKLQLEEQHLRLQADFDNYRKRSRGERDEVVKMANSRLIGDLLPVLDNFERAVAALPEDAGREGVQLIHRQLLEVLGAAGLAQIEAVGADFDPQFHEAVLQTDEGPEQTGKVIAEAQKGYLLNGKLLRPSLVQVGS